VGRWTQKDPLNLFQDPKQGNRYAYAGGDPANTIDPSGALSLDPCDDDPVDVCGGVEDAAEEFPQGVEGALAIRNKLDDFARAGLKAAKRGRPG
jgi:hypothetical protein